MFKQILIIDDNRHFSSKLQKKLQNVLKAIIDCVEDITPEITHSYDHQVYIIRLDDKHDDIIKKLINQDKFVILITQHDNQDTRKKILSYNASDYVVDNSEISIDFVSKIILRLQSNATKTILTVDDSKLVLTQMAILLESQNIHYVQCLNGAQAWEYLQSTNSKKIDLVITDYEMPLMNGYELVKLIRTKFSFEELPILVVSGSENTYMISRFLKVGANDYITKPFISEEFMSRVSNALLLVSMFNKIKSMAMTDHLTGVHNRVYFYETGLKILDNANRAKQESAIAMIDIDNFKKVNDTYGHEAGDKALIHVAQTIQKSLRRSDVFVRFGGEEFVILLPNCPHIQALKVAQKVCDVVAKSPCDIGTDKNITITISIGVTTKVQNIDKMIETADKYMYLAKKSGKNRIVSQSKT